MSYETTLNELWKICLDSSIEVGRLRAALEFYADPNTYAAIGFFPDPPCGEFIDDFSDDHGDEILVGPRPGRIARLALDRPEEWAKEMAVRDVET